MSNKSTSLIDVAVGRAIRAQRLLAGMSQTELGGRIGVSFQQVQKYENGTNRVSTARLTAIASALGRPVEAFLTNGKGKDAPLPAMLTDPLGVEVARNWERLSESQRRALRKLVATMVD